MSASRQSTPRRASAGAPYPPSTRPSSRLVRGAGRSTTRPKQRSVSRFMPPSRDAISRSNRRRTTDRTDAPSLGMGRRVAAQAPYMSRSSRTSPVVVARDPERCAVRRCSVSRWRDGATDVRGRGRTCESAVGGVAGVFCGQVLTPPAVGPWCCRGFIPRRSDLDKNQTGLPDPNPKSTPAFLRAGIPRLGVVCL